MSTTISQDGTFTFTSIPFRGNWRRCLLGLALAVTVQGAAPAAGPGDDLRAAVEARFLGDRSGACLAAALVGPAPGSAPATAFVCADPAGARPLDAHTTFEVGNLSRVMVSALVARMASRGELALDDPLAGFLPKAAKVPDFQGRPITLRHLLDHVSGLPTLPGRLDLEDEADPFAALTPDQLLGSLGDATLEQAPGTRYRASTFGMMLLTYALAQRQGRDFQSLLTRGLFAPLGMADAHLVRLAPPAPEAQGHASNGRPVKAWNMPPDLAGGGGVRASLADLIRFAQAALGQGPADLTAALAATLAEPPAGSVSPNVMNWRIIRRDGQVIHLCEGATGGFSSFLAIDPQRRQAVILLSDTALANVGGLEPLGLSLLDPAFPSPGFPRRAYPPGELLLASLAGHYRLADGAGMTLASQGGKLTARFGDQTAHPLGFDSAGDFYALDADFLIHPIRSGEGYAFSLRQGGGHLEAQRLDAPVSLDALLDAKGLQELEGDYPMKEAFTVTVTSKDGSLYVKGTNQPVYLVIQVRKDVFATISGSAEFTFTRDASGKVKSLSVRQNGKTMTGNRH